MLTSSTIFSTLMKNEYGASEIVIGLTYMCVHDCGLVYKDDGG